MLHLRSLQQRLQATSDEFSRSMTTNQEQALQQIDIHKQLRTAWSSELREGEHLLWTLLCQESGQQLYSLAQRLSAAGDHSTADVLLSQHLGYRIRLSDIVWSQSRRPKALTQALESNKKHSTDPDSPSSSKKHKAALTTVTAPTDIIPTTSTSNQSRSGVSHPAKSHGSQPVEFPTPESICLALSTALILESPLSKCVEQAVAAALDPQSQYWQDHHYGEDGTPFFSYLAELAQPPTNVIGQAITDLAAALRCCPLTAETMSHVVAAEWWAHCRDPGDAHQLHFDMDERALGQGRASYSLKHPLLSSVLFMGESGGPTLVLDQNPLQPNGLADRAWAVHPAPGCYLVFPGDMLHGVLPGIQHTSSETYAVQDSSNSSSPSHSNKRVTLIVAWWGKEILHPKMSPAPSNPQASASSTFVYPAPPQTLHACMQSLYAPTVTNVPGASSLGFCKPSNLDSSGPLETSDHGLCNQSGMVDQGQHGSLSTSGGTGRAQIGSYLIPRAISPAWQVLLQQSSRQESLAEDTACLDMIRGAQSVEAGSGCQDSVGTPSHFCPKFGCVGGHSSEVLQQQPDGQQSDTANTDRVESKRASGTELDGTELDTKVQKQTDSADMESCGKENSGSTHPIVSLDSKVAMTAIFAETLPPLRFFLKHEQEIHDVYVMHTGSQN